jgi:hypothetical protein
MREAAPMSGEFAESEIAQEIRHLNERLTGIEEAGFHSGTDLIAAALAKAQNAFKNVPKTKTGVHDSKYADLADIMEMVRKPLSDNGLAISHSTDDQLMLVTTLLHTSGQSLSTTLPLSGGRSLQDLGSSITYMRRYSIGILLGVVTEEDEDGQLSQDASKGPQQSPAKAPAAPRKKTTRKAAPKKAPEKPAQESSEKKQSNLGPLWGHCYKMGAALGESKQESEDRLHAMMEKAYKKESSRALTQTEVNELVAEMQKIIEDNTPPE